MPDRKPDCEKNTIVRPGAQSHALGSGIVRTLMAFEQY